MIIEFIGLINPLSLTYRKYTVTVGNVNKFRV